MPGAEIPASEADRQEILSEEPQHLQGSGKKSESSDETRASESHKTAGGP